MNAWAWAVAATAPQQTIQSERGLQIVQHGIQGGKVAMDIGEQRYPHECFSLCRYPARLRRIFALFPDRIYEIAGTPGTSIKVW